MAEKGACSKKEGRVEPQFNLDGNASMLLSIFCCGSLGSKGRLHRRHLYKKGEAYLAGLKEGAQVHRGPGASSGWSGRVLTHYYGIGLWVTRESLSGI